jgi:3-methyladenine DNA glycosylase/8-oxoguanine DNA glycosylase
MTKLSHCFGFDLKPVPPYDFRLTVRKPAGWSLFTQFEVYENNTLWTAYFDRVLLGIKFGSRGTVKNPKIRVEIFLKKRPTADQIDCIKETISRKLGVRQDLRDFYRMARKDSILKHVVKDLYGMHDTNPGSIFDTALLAIALQMTNIKRSNQMMDSLIKNYGETAAFDGKKIRVWPRPETLAGLNPKSLAKKCNLGYRARNIVKLSKKLSTESFPSVEELETLKPEEAHRRLFRRYHKPSRRFSNRCVVC